MATQVMAIESDDEPESSLTAQLIRDGDPNESFSIPNGTSR